MLVDTDFVQQFRRDGFVVVDGLITDAELDDYETLVTEAVARRKRDAPPLAERGAYAQSFHQCINLWEDFPAGRPLTFPRTRVTGGASAVVLAAQRRRIEDRRRTGRSTHPFPWAAFTASGG